MFMAMPKATIDEDHRSIFAKHQIRMARKARMVQPIAEASAEQELPHQHFRFRVLALYSGHAAMTLLFSQFIHTSQVHP